MIYTLMWIPEMFQYPFMIKAFIIGIIVSWITSCIGIVIVLKRLSMVGDALSHASLAGVAAGLISGINPVVGAMGVSVLAALGVEYLRRTFGKYSEVSIAIILSAGISIAGELSGFIKQAANFNSFLFGSIVTINDFEFYLVIIVGIAVLILSILFYRQLFFITFDEDGAVLAGIPVKTINYIFLILTALTVAIASRTVGSLIISSLLVLPVATAIQLGRSYRSTLWLSISLSTIYMVVGLTLSYYWDLKPGATVVLLSVIGLLCVIFGKKLYTKMHNKRILKT